MRSIRFFLTLKRHSSEGGIISLGGLAGLSRRIIPNLSRRIIPNSSPSHNPNSNPSWGFALLVLIFAFILGSCGNEASKFRNYKEITLSPSERPISQPSGQTNNIFAELIMEEAQSAALAWTLPEAWEEQENSAGGIRFASFRSKSTEAELVIVGFPGDVGGLRANVARWLGQMNLSLSATRLDRLVSSLELETNAQSVRYIPVDLTSLVERPSEEAIFAVILRFPDQSIFLKMQAERRTVQLEVDNITAFLSSLRLDGGRS